MIMNLSDRLHILSVYRCNEPCVMLREHEKSLSATKCNRKLIIAITHSHISAKIWLLITDHFREFCYSFY